MTQVDLEGVTFTLLAQGEDYRVVRRDMVPTEFYVDRSSGYVTIAPENHVNGNTYAAIDLPDEAAREVAEKILEVLEE